jgi:hypothetical protein
VILQKGDSTNPTISLSTQADNCADPNGSYGTIATGAVSNTAWTKVQGTFSFDDVPGAPWVVFVTQTVVASQPATYW